MRIVCYLVSLLSRNRSWIIPKFSNSLIPKFCQKTMQFQVPQFIEIEDKVFGPFTFKQFVYLLGAVAALYIPFKFWGVFVALLVGGPVAAFAIALAFAKVNGRSFIFTAESYVKYFFSSKLYLWKHQDKAVQTQMAEEKSVPRSMIVPTLSQNKLKDLAWALDVREIANKKPEVGVPGK